jgi:hypothetical protein
MRLERARNIIIFFFLCHGFFYLCSSPKKKKKKRKKEKKQKLFFAMCALGILPGFPPYPTLLLVSSPNYLPSVHLLSSYGDLSTQKRQ